MASILVIDHNRASLAVARAFHGLGFKVILGVAGYCDYANLSRFVSETVTIADLVNSPEKVLGDIKALCAARSDLRGIFSVDETGTRWLALNAHRLPDSLTVYTARPDNILASFNKADTAKLAEALAVPVAPRLVASTFDELKAAAEEIGPPFVVRAVESNHDLYGVKVLVCHSIDEFECTVTHWPEEDHRQLMVQRFNPGRRHNICWNAIHGRIHSAIEMKVLQTTTGSHSGYGTLVETVEPDPSLQHYAVSLAEALGYHGPGSAQFLIDEKSRDITFLEINPRLDANIKLAQSVMPYIETAAGIIEGRISEPLNEPWAYRRGKRLFWMKGENQTLQALLRQGRYRRMAGRALMMGPRSLGAVHGLFSWDDPLPALAAHLNPILKRLPRPGVTDARRIKIPGGTRAAQAAERSG